MRDLKKTNQKTKKIRRNRRKQEKKPMNLRKNLRRFLRVSVTLFSALMIVVGGFFVVQLLMASDLFKVDQISVKGNHRLDDSSIIALSDIQSGVNTFNLDLGLIGRKIEENPWVQQARVERIFPRQVIVEIQERKPVAIVNLGYLYYLDVQGEVFKVLDASDKLDYPMITGFDYERAKGHDEVYVEKFKQIVGLLKNLKKRNQFNLKQVSEIHHDSDGGMVLFTMKGSVEIKLGRDDFIQKIDRLERIYTQLQPKLKILDYIDLNVKEKVIVRIERSSKTAKS
jgi:cell division protein FtsQ